MKSALVISERDNVATALQALEPGQRLDLGESTLIVEEPIAPGHKIKITGNSRTARSMADNIDLDVSGIITETDTLDGAAARLFDEVLAVVGGKETAAERLGHREFAIHRRNPTI